MPRVIVLNVSYTEVAKNANGEWTTRDNGQVVKERIMTPEQINFQATQRLLGWGGLTVYLDRGAETVASEEVIRSYIKLLMEDFSEDTFESLMLQPYNYNMADRTFCLFVRRPEDIQGVASGELGVTTATITPGQSSQLDTSAMKKVDNKELKTTSIAMNKIKQEKLRLAKIWLARDPTNGEFVALRQREMNKRGEQNRREEGREGMEGGGNKKGYNFYFWGAYEVVSGTIVLAKTLGINLSPAEVYGSLSV